MAVETGTLGCEPACGKEWTDDRHALALAGAWRRATV